MPETDDPKIPVRFSIIIPVYNEQATVIQILERVRAQAVDGAELETIVINDGSSDGTGELLAGRPDLYDKLVDLARNQGKGAAVKAGLAAATGEYVMFQDADLEYDPAEFANVFRPALKFGADAVIGSRFIAPACTRVFYFWNKFGNRLITFAFNVLNNTTFTDVYSCYLLYRRSLIDPAELKTVGWEQHAEILSLAVRNGRSFYEVPISYYGRNFAEGKKIRAHHAIAVLLTILRCRLFR
jgi:glycosyltransferase involved in cell wall biosynthesis